jgi:hypothetical protein
MLLYHSTLLLELLVVILILRSARDSYAALCTMLRQYP